MIRRSTSQQPALQPFQSSATPQNQQRPIGSPSSLAYSSFDSFGSMQPAAVAQSGGPGVPPSGGGGGGGATLSSSASSFFAAGGSSGPDLLPLPNRPFHGGGGGGGGVGGGGIGGSIAAMTRSELVHSLANRILHSTFYQWFYLVMMGLSIVCLILSTIQMCPTGFFYFLEAVVNLIMIFEVLIRFYALGQVFWKSLWNVLDVILVVFCVFTLFWLLFGTCTTERSWETEADTLLLVVRNGIQFSRLAVMLGKNRGGRPLLPTAIRPGGSGGAAGASSRIDLSTADPNVVVVGGMLGDESDPFLSPMVRNTGFVNFEGEDDDFI